MIDPTRIAHGMLKEVAAGVWQMPVLIANVYLVGQRGEPWVLVDTGVPGGAGRIRSAAEHLFGDSKPAAIVLTHGHQDHVGCLLKLADDWSVPVYAHRLELPYLTGRAVYPQPDPTVGGAFAQIARTVKNKPMDFGDRVRALPADGTSPFLPGWELIDTPGHSPGHISLFRASDRTLLSGDAVITTNLDNPWKLVSSAVELNNPPAAFTPDWEKTRSSIYRLATLKPFAIGAGHGRPMSGDQVAGELERFAREFRPPLHGRYVNYPVKTDDAGKVTWTPAAPTDPLPMYAAGAALAVATGLVFAWAGHQRQKRKTAVPVAVRAESQELPKSLLDPFVAGPVDVTKEPAGSYQVPSRLRPGTVEGLNVQENPQSRNVERI